jgi:Ca2+-binding EF-hand superfamily protein
MHNVSDNINISNLNHSENSLFDLQTKNLIIKILTLISTSEKKIEILRRVLTDSRDFDFNMIFKRFEMNSNTKDKITPELILDFLRLNSIFCDIQKIKMFISFYDRDNDGSLNFSEFKNFLISSQDPVMRATLTSSNLSTQQWHTLKNYNIPINISHTLIKLFIEEIQCANKILELQKILCSSLTYNAWNLYSLIDRDNKDSIYLHNLEDFLNEFSPGRFSRSNIEALFYRMDISKDDRISFNEFQVFFTYRNFSKITTLENEEYFGYNIADKSVNLHSKKSSVISDENLSFSRSPLNMSMTKSMNVDESQLIKSINYSNPKNQPADRNYPSQSSVLASPYYKRFSSLEEEMLINFFKTLVDYEREIEEIRVKLAKHVDFNLCELYQIFLTQNEDRDGFGEDINRESEKFKYLKNYHMVELLSVEKFKNGINFFSAYPTEKEMRLIFNRHIQRKTKFIE